VILVGQDEVLYLNLTDIDDCNPTTMYMAPFELGTLASHISERRNTRPEYSAIRSYEGCRILSTNDATKNKSQLARQTKYTISVAVNVHCVRVSAIDLLPPT